jgi:hypothetical protein
MIENKTSLSKAISLKNMKLRAINNDLLLMEKIIGNVHTLPLSGNRPRESNICLPISTLQDFLMPPYTLRGLNFPFKHGLCVGTMAVCKGPQ